LVAEPAELSVDTENGEVCKKLGAAAPATHSRGKVGVKMND